MNREKINYVKSELRNLQYYNSEIHRAEREREKAISKLTGVTSPSGKQEPISTSTSSDRGNLYYWLEKEKEATDIINNFQARVDKIQEFLKVIGDKYRRMLIDIYVKNRNMDNVAIMNYYTDKVELHRDLDSIIDTFF